LGPYGLRDAIGAGGMGEVYRASRADAEYQQQVAIKLVRAGLDIAYISARLRAERHKDWQSARDAFGRALKMYEELMPAWAKAAAGARTASDEIQHCERALAMALNARR